MLWYNTENAAVPVQFNANFHTPTFKHPSFSIWINLYAKDLRAYIFGRDGVVELSCCWRLLTHSYCRGHVEFSGYNTLQIPAKCFTLNLRINTEVQHFTKCIPRNTFAKGRLAISRAFSSLWSKWFVLDIFFSAVFCLCSELRERYR